MTACVVLAVILAAIAIAAHFLDPRALAASLTASVKADTGRELTIGDAGFKLLPRPAFVLSNVRFGNAAWGSQPWLAQAGRVSADADLIELLFGRLRIGHIAVTDASLFLETDPDGNGNWVLGVAKVDVPAWLKRLEIDEFALQAVAFTYRNGASGRVTSVRIDSARIAAPSASRPIQLSARGTYHGKKVEVTGTVGALEALIASAAAYPLNLDGKVDAANVSMHGTIDQPRGVGGFSLALRAQVPELASFLELFGVTAPPLGPFRGATRLTGTPAAPVFSDIDVELGTPERMGLTARGELVGSISTGGGYEWQSTGVDLLLQGAQFSDLAQWSGKPLPAWGPYRIAARMAGPAVAPGLTGIDATIGGRGKPEIKLRGAIANPRAASGIDLMLSAVAGEWWRPGTAADEPPLPPFRASARLRDARQGYSVNELEVKIADSTVNASLQVMQRGPRLRITGKASSTLIDLARLPPAPAATTAPAAAAATPRAADPWKLADADLDLKIGRLVLPDRRELQSASGRLALDNGRLKATALQATLGGANVKLDGSVDNPQQLAGLELRVSIQGKELAALFKFFGTSIAPVGPYQGHAQLYGSRDALGMKAIDATAGRPGQNLHISGQIEDATKQRGVKLAIAANLSDSVAAGRWFDADLPLLPALRATARFTGPQGGYVFDDLKLALGRTSVQGRVVFVPGKPRPRVTANLSGPLVDLAELPSIAAKTRRNESAARGRCRGRRPVRPRGAS